MKKRLIKWNWNSAKGKTWNQEENSCEIFFCKNFHLNYAFSFLFFLLFMWVVTMTNNLKEENVWLNDVKDNVLKKIYK